MKQIIKACAVFAATIAGIVMLCNWSLHDTWQATKAVGSGVLLGSAATKGGVTGGLARQQIINDSFKRK